MKPLPEQVQQLVAWIEKNLNHDDFDQYFFQVFEHPFDKTKLLMGRDGNNVEVLPSTIEMAVDLGVIHNQSGLWASQWYVYTKKKET